LFSRITYYLLVVPVSKFPDKVLYAFSRLLCFVAYRIFGYRRNVIRENLSKSFPDLDSKSLKLYEKRFYQYFADFLVESARAISFDADKLTNYCSVDNIELLESQLKKGKHVFVLSGHYNNWEYYSICFAKLLDYPMIAAYQPLSNKFFDSKIKSNREKSGLKLIDMKQLPAYLKDKNTEPTITILLSDQRPKNLTKVYWTEFLNQKTAWMKGPEQLARMFDTTVFFGHIRQKERGKYNVKFDIISESASNEESGYITTRFSSKMEEMIKEDPPFWLWSHKRWKNQ
jgi:Kdo2-lipid IVA lauroyltransferase/acyltransferase